MYIWKESKIKSFSANHLGALLLALSLIFILAYSIFGEVGGVRTGGETARSGSTGLDKARGCRSRF